MGTDIHWVWEQKTTDGWEEIVGLDDSRDYLLFAWLANVRNGVGFAGVATFQPITPIAPLRGLPKDTLVRVTKDGDARYGGGKSEKWLGEHSFSWLTAAEILAAPGVEVLHRIGVVELAEFHACEAEGRAPRSWSGGIFGPGIVVSEPSSITEKTTHVRMTWDDPVPLQWFVDDVKTLQDRYGEVRVLFGFDS